MVADESTLQLDSQADVSDWLNKLYSREDARGNPELFSSKLVAALQEQFAKAQADIGRTAAQLPDMGTVLAQNSIRSESTTLRIKGDLDRLEKNLHERNDSSTDELVARIRATQLVKLRMETTFRALESQDNWGTLLSNMRDVIANGDPETVHSRLQSMMKCYSSLSDAPNGGDRKAQLDEIKNSVETVMTPRIVGAVSSTAPWKSTGSQEIFLSKAAHLYFLMDRGETLKRIVRESYLKLFESYWNKLLREFQEQTEQSYIEQLLKLFYEDLGHSIPNLLKLFHGIFESPPAAVRELYASLLQRINPEIQRLMESSWKKNESASGAEEFLSGLLEIKRAAQYFIQISSRDLGDSSLSMDIVKPLEQTLVVQTSAEGTIIKSELQSLCPSQTESKKTYHNLLHGAARIRSIFSTSFIRWIEITDGRRLDDLRELCEESLDRYIQSVTSYLDTVVSSTEHNYKGTFLDTDDSGYNALETMTKVLVHYGDLIVNLDHDGLAFHVEASNGTSFELSLPNSISRIHSLALDLLKRVRTLVLAPLEGFLAKVGSLPSWSSGSSQLKADIPSFALDPQEYMTAVGNYLLTLPQILDPLIPNDHSASKRLRNMLQKEQIMYNGEEDESVGLTEKLIQIIVLDAVEKVIVALMTVKMMTVGGIKQMVCDLRYLQNVVQDFAVDPGVRFQALFETLTCSPNEFADKAAGAPKDIAQFASKVREM